jgi:hypothetical protein
MIMYELSNNHHVIMIMYSLRLIEHFNKRDEPVNVAILWDDIDSRHTSPPQQVPGPIDELEPGQHGGQAAPEVCLLGTWAT